MNLAGGLRKSSTTRLTAVKLCPIICIRTCFNKTRRTGRGAAGVLNGPGIARTHIQPSTRSSIAAEWQ